VFAALDRCFRIPSAKLAKADIAPKDTNLRDGCGTFTVLEAACEALTDEVEAPISALLQHAAAPPKAYPRSSTKKALCPVSQETIA
jgi:hypothetical protein